MWEARSWTDMNNCKLTVATGSSQFEVAEASLLAIIVEAS